MTTVHEQHHAKHHGSTGLYPPPTPVEAGRPSVEATKPGLTCEVDSRPPTAGKEVISLAHTAETALVQVMTAQPATTDNTTVSGAGQVIVIGIPILIIGLIGYLCKHRRHKPSTALLGFVAGVLLAGTALGATLAGSVTTLIVNGFSAIGGLFTG
jgi:hypothetical protein